MALDRAGRLRASREDLFEALQPEELSAKHRFVLNEILAHIEYLKATMARFEQQLLDCPGGVEPPGFRHTPGTRFVKTLTQLVTVRAHRIASSGLHPLPEAWRNICFFPIAGKPLKMVGQREPPAHEATDQHV